MQSFDQQNLQFNPSLEKSSFGQPQTFQQAGGQSWSNAPTAPSMNGIRTRGWNNRRINLRTRNWGSRSENGWSGFNRARYSPAGLSQWEWQSPILRELRSQFGGNRGVTFAAAPAIAAIPAAPATIVPVNMLPAPINDGSKYAKLVGNGRGSRKYRKHLKQPLSSAAPLTPLSAGLLNQGYALPATALPASGQKLSRKQRKALKRQNSGTPLTRLGTSATSGINGLGAAPLAPINGFASSNQGLSRQQKRALKKQNKAAKKQNAALLKQNGNSFFAPNALPAGQPVVNAIPVTNVLASPVLSAAAPLAPVTNTFVKTQQMPLVSPVAVGRSAF